jgi:hypothetical protein
MPVIPANWGAQVGESQVEAQSGKISGAFSQNTGLGDVSTVADSEILCA